MSFNSLDTILQRLEQQPGWEKQQEYRRLLECWKTVVDPKIAAQSRPLYIARQILWVATSNSVWAQTLSFQRHALLKQLNPHLSEPIVDIRFSPAQWHNTSPSITPDPSVIAPDILPDSSLEQTAPEDNSENIPLDFPAPTTPANSPEIAFQRWAQVIGARSQHLSPCPQCQCPTPPEELQRWSICAYCAAKKWSSNQGKNQP